MESTSEFDDKIELCVSEDSIAGFLTNKETCKSAAVQCDIKGNLCDQPQECLYSEFSTKLNELRKQHCYCDTILKIGEKSWKCHRIILASASHKLHEAMTHILVRLGSMIEIKLPDCFNTCAMDALMELIYLGDLKHESEYGKEMLIIAKYLEISLPNLSSISAVDDSDLLRADNSFSDNYVTTIAEPVVLRLLYDDTAKGTQRQRRQQQKKHRLKDYVYEDISEREEKTEICDRLQSKQACKLLSQQYEDNANIEKRNSFSNLTKVASDAYENLETKEANRCLPCNMKFENRRQFFNHQRLKHKNKKYPCGFCKKLFNRKADMKLHERRKHAVTKPYPCKECDASFAQNRQLQLHCRVHTDGHAFKCETCDKTFISSEGYKNHLQHAHAEKKHICDNQGCSSAFSSAKQLKRHKLTCKNDVNLSSFKQFQCEKCGKTFRWSHLLKRHCSSVHLKIKPFKCSECTRSFNRSEQLEQHLTTHSGKRDNKCSECGKTFKQKAGLYVHQKIHSNIFKEVCDVCGYCCHSKSVLRVHQLTHSDEKPFSCERCSKSFKAMKYLKRHELIHNKVKTKKKTFTPGKIPLASATPTTTITSAVLTSTSLLQLDPALSPLLPVLPQSNASELSISTEPCFVALTPAVAPLATNEEDALSIYFNQESLQASLFSVEPTDFVPHSQ
ncbi:uncharacterized protein LOC143470053 isoform X2 [Clavelina lepadiformis]